MGCPGRQQKKENMSDEIREEIVETEESAVMEEDAVIVTSVEKTAVEATGKLPVEEIEKALEEAKPEATNTKVPEWLKEEEPKKKKGASILKKENRETPKEFRARLKKGSLQLLIYFGIFAFSICFWEILLRLQMGGGIHSGNLFFLFFVPAQALVLTAVNGIFPQKVNRFLFPATILAVAVFYCIQMVYYRIFGSLISVSLLGMGGDAVGNFWWAMEETVIKSLGLVLLMIVPAIAALVLCLTKKVKCNPYPVLLHVICLLLAVGLWFAGAEGLRVGGDGRQSAYFAFHSSISDTDTTASRVGCMTTTLVEAGSFYLGLGGSEDISTLTQVDMDSIMLEPEPVEEKVIEKTEKPSEETSEVEEKVEIERIPYVYDEIDFEALADSTQRADLRDMYTYFGQRRATTTNEYTGLLEGYNLIYVCAESFWSLAIDERVTPTLYMMANNGIVLENYYNSFRNTTTNGEYAFSTSLWPDMSRQADSGLDVGSFPQSSAKFMPVGLGDYLSTENVPSYAFHNYYGNYYRRRLSWPNLGYENCYFMNQGMTFTTTWPSSDAEMFQQSTDHYINEDRFFAYYMTFSGHGPYNTNNCMYRKNIEEVKLRLGDDATNYSNEALGYFAGNIELEYSMSYLLKELEKAGKLDNTLIVITGDHYPYYLSEAARANIAGHPISEFDIFKSTCIMYSAGIEEPIVTDVPCCNVDIIPTVLNLLGVKFDSRLIMGTDIFSNGIHKAVLYDKSFITNKAIYNAKTGEITWLVDTDLYDMSNLYSYIENMSALVASEYSASVNIIKTNFYYNLWVDSGLMTAEEAAAEQERERLVQTELADINAEEQRLREEAAARKAAEEEAARIAAEQAAAEGQQ